MFLGQNLNLSLLKHSKGIYINFEKKWGRILRWPRDFQWKSYLPSSLPALPACSPLFHVTVWSMESLFLSHQGLDCGTASTHQVFLLSCTARGPYSSQSYRGPEDKGLTDTHSHTHSIEIKKIEIRGWQFKCLGAESFLQILAYWEITLQKQCPQNTTIKSFAALLEKESKPNPTVTLPNAKHSAEVKIWSDCLCWAHSERKSFRYVLLLHAAK